MKDYCESLSSICEENDRFEEDLGKINEEDVHDKGLAVSGLVGRNLFKKINESNFDKLCEVIFEPEFSSAPDYSFIDAPLWARVLIKYYSHRADIIKLMKQCNIATPEGIENFRLPMDWTQEELDTFFKNAQNWHALNTWFVTNLREWCDFCFGPVEEWCASPCGIPWDYVLMNKLLNSEDNCLTMARLVNEGVGFPLLSIWRYQELSDENFKVLIDAINIDATFPKTRQGRESAFALLFHRIDKITDPKKLDFLYREALRRDCPSDYIEKMQKEYIIKYFIETDDVGCDFIFNANNLTKEERAQIICSKIK